jgi:hypothetical protein
MKSPIAGIVPPEIAEVTSTVVWPSIGAYRLGRLVGRWCGLRLGVGFFTLGKAMALLTIPLSLALYVWKILPWICRRYRLTSRRIVIQKGYSAKDVASIGLDQFDAIDIQTLRGQAWLRCGEMLFLVRRGSPDPAPQAAFRLSGVPRPEVFRQICLEAQTALLSVREVLRRQQAAAQ